MKKRQPISVRVTVSGDELMETALANLSGRPLRGSVYSGNDKFGESYNNDSARHKSAIFEEAIYALEDFFEQHGYIPRTVRFEATDAGPATGIRPRRDDRCREMRVVENALDLATKLTSNENP